MEELHTELGETLTVKNTKQGVRDWIQLDLSPGCRALQWVRSHGTICSVISLGHYWLKRHATSPSLRFYESGVTLSSWITTEASKASSIRVLSFVYINYQHISSNCQVRIVRCTSIPLWSLSFIGHVKLPRIDFWNYLYCFLSPHFIIFVCQYLLLIDESYKFQLFGITTYSLIQIVAMFQLQVTF